jgi:post-segregation antitoxin (ccd killing protein)
MNSNNKSIIIEGDKTLFTSKAAIDRLKRDLREDNKEKLAINNYLNEGWTYKIISNTDTQIKIELVKEEKENVINEPIISEQSEQDERRKILKERLKMARISKLSPVQIKQNLKNKVPSDVLESYLKLKKVQLKVPVPPPDLVLSKPEEFKKIVHTMVQSFGMFNGTNNPVVNYYRLLAKHLDLPTTFIPPKPANDKPNEQTNDFIEMLRKQRDNNIKDSVDDEMKEIYKSLGINMEEKKEVIVDDEMKEIYKSLGINMEEKKEVIVDDEMKEIYKSLGVNMEEKKEVIVDDEMKEIYKSLGIKIENEVKQPVVVDDEWLKL